MLHDQLQSKFCGGNCKKNDQERKFKSINLHNLKVHKQPGLHGKFQDSQELHRDWPQNTKKKKPFSCEECIPYRKKHLAVVNKMDLYLCYKAHFYLDRKVLCGNIKLYSTIFSFCVGCLHAGQRTGISLGPVVQTHVVRLGVPTQSRMFVLQLQAVIMQVLGDTNTLQL